MVNSNSVIKTLEHGGNVAKASDHYKIPEQSWQDLSTGISPWVWPVPQLPKKVWASLPSTHKLLRTAQAYYQTNAAKIVATAGSQIPIRSIPTFLSPGRVAIPYLGYQEHRFAWQKAGHTVVTYDNWASLEAAVVEGRVDHVVVINPNNPTSVRMSAMRLKRLHQRMDANNLLLVDEAFADIGNDQSLADYCDTSGVVVLRSFGKFFGLAGLRLGFAFGNHPVLEQLAASMAPWGVSSPAIHIGQLAMEDTFWQQLQRLRISTSSSILARLVCDHLPSCKVVNGGLFVTAFGRASELRQCYKRAASRGILLRYEQYEANLAWLRIGLADDNYQRLKDLWHS